MKSTPKIRGYIAREGFTALFLYRKSNKVTYLVSLNYRNRSDKFKVGSRFYGQIYPNRCGLSPDGKEFIYFAMGKSQLSFGKKYYTWTAVSNPPMLKANLFIPSDTTYGGGGYFIDRENLYIADTLHVKKELIKGISDGNYYGNYKITFDAKYNDGRWDSQKYGWSVTGKNKQGYPVAWKKEESSVCLVKSVKNNHMKDGEFSMHEYSMLDEKGIGIDAGDDRINWADFDNYGRLIITSGSKIRIYKNKASLLKRNCIEFDLNEIIESRKT
jgi:hypothetical protein